MTNLALAQEAATWLDPRELVPWPGNPRLNDSAVDAVARSITRFGFAAPIVARRSDLRVIAGHTRLKAALRLGLEQVPVRLVELSDDECTALSLADNKLGELAEWDQSALDALVAEGVNLEGLGWGADEPSALAVSDAESVNLSDEIDYEEEASVLRFCVSVPSECVGEFKRVFKDHALPMGCVMRPMK